MLDVKCIYLRGTNAANSYLISSDGEYAIIDPTVSPDMMEAGDIVKNTRYIFLTHSHFDHIYAVDSWKEQSGARVLVCEKEIEGPSDPDFNCNRLFFGTDNGYFGEIEGMKEGDVFPLGSESLTVMELPGHTKGSIALLSEGCAFVGDTVFAGGGFGRWDLPSGDADALMSSIERVIKLHPDTVLYCGHGDPTTVSEYQTDFYKKFR